MRLPWLLTALVASAVLAGLHFNALAHFWYWKYRWLDTPMHLLGGAVLAIFAVALLRSFRPFTFLALMALAAVGWEVFEYVFGISTGQPNYLLDTVHDILNDAIGASFVYVVARFTVWRSA